MAEQTTAADGSAAPGAEAASQESELDALLGEFDKSAPDPKPVRQDNSAAILKQVAPVIKFAQTQMAKEEKDSVDTAVGDAVSAFKEADELKGLPEQFVRGFLYDRASTDKSFEEAFKQRGENPQAWTRALDEAQSAAVEAMKGVPDSKITADVDAAKAAVQGTVTEPSDDSDDPDGRKLNKELNKKSDAEFRQYKAGLEVQ